ncbi:MAG: carbohydrate-binding domain-containing protein, partial [Clostridia bacterium]|nr:carbohydrate-binding domain-containing protein [Clostridia bacterium]
MKKFIFFLTVYVVACLIPSGCGVKDQPISQSEANAVQIEGTAVVLSDEGITVDGAAISADTSAAVYVANDIVYYEEGKDFTYGEGTEADAHSAEEAAAHTVVHITQPGTYVLSGTLSKGQVAVDLGENAEEDPEAVVTLVLNGVDIACEVAPAVIFYDVYECGSTDTETACETVDTTAAGAKVILADGTENHIQGSYVARIYKPGTVELSEDGTEVADAKKLHKYDAAFYSKRTMNVSGGEAGTGVLNITAENEGLDSELHLTINGGNIHITSGNDGINTNEDGVSVTTINGGTLDIVVTGETGEGDGIDSNGWLVINGGTVTASACSFSGDAGIDSDMGIHVNGGTVLAGGNMLDRLEEGGQNYAVFTFAQSQSGGSEYTLKNAAGEAVVTWVPANDFSILVASAPELTAGEYTFWQGETRLAASSGMGGFGGGMRPGGQRPGGMEPPEG